MQWAMAQAIISLTHKQTLQEPGLHSMEGELAASEPLVFRTAENMQLEYQLAYPVLKRWLSCLPPWSNFSYVSPGFSDVSFRSISRNQTSINHTVARQPIMTETPIDKATVRLLSGKFAAFHTICDGCEIPVHRMIISEECRVFQPACTGELTVSNISSLRIPN